MSDETPAVTIHQCEQTMKEMQPDPSGPKGFISIGVTQFSDLTNKVFALEELAQRTVKQGHTNACWIKRQRTPDLQCFCLHDLAQRALKD